MPRSLWTPADPPRTHPIVLFVLASGPLRPSPSALAISGLYQASGNAVFLVAYVIPCVRFNCLVRRFRASVTIATLGTNDWLGLVRQRLSLCKKRQALLGAPTDRVSRARSGARRLDARVGRRLDLQPPMPMTLKSGKNIYLFRFILLRSNQSGIHHVFEFLQLLHRVFLWD